MDPLVARSLRVGLVTLGLLAAVARAAKAETGDVVVAEALFRDGKELLARKDYARACPKLSESFRRDPATGTLLALAMCHEREGKLASAWGEYSDVASRSKGESRVDRERAARSKALELEPTVSRLTIALSEDASELATLEVKCNGAVLGPAILGTALPVDGGSYVIEASSPGKEKWIAKLTLASSGDRRTVRVPLLEDAQRPPAAAKPAPATVKAAPRSKPAADSTPADVAPAAATEKTAESSASETPAPDARSGLTGLQHAAIVTGIAGAAGIGVGTFFTLRAVSKNNDSKAGCVDDLCTPAAKQARLDARSAGNFATVGLVGGSTLAAAGLVMFIVGRRSEPRSTVGSILAVPMASADGVGAMVRGSF